MPCIFDRSKRLAVDFQSRANLGEAIVELAFALALEHVSTCAERKLVELGFYLVSIERELHVLVLQG